MELADATAGSATMPHRRPPLELGLPPSPLARGIGWRLAWAIGLSGLLWLGVAWALA